MLAWIPINQTPGESSAHNWRPLCVWNHGGVRALHAQLVPPERLRGYFANVVESLSCRSVDSLHLTHVQGSAPARTATGCQTPSGGALGEIGRASCRER